ncbi:hypothetical protein [Polaromonas sp.]|uniref:hypothetical protein n=1 Tax=Polaromonas sp. TaxID=1869339 RepID=UPI00352BA882
MTHTATARAAIETNGPHRVNLGFMDRVRRSPAAAVVESVQFGVIPRVGRVISDGPWIAA